MLYRRHGRVSVMALRDSLFTSKGDHLPFWDSKTLRARQYPEWCSLTGVPLSSLQKVKGQRLAYSSLEVTGLNDLDIHILWFFFFFLNTKIKSRISLFSIIIFKFVFLSFYLAYLFMFLSYIIIILLFFSLIFCKHGVNEIHYYEIKLYFILGQLSP